MTRKQKRLTVIAGGLSFIAAAAALTFVALGQRTSYFYMPADLAKATVAPGERIRLGGLVEKGSIVRGEGTRVSFAVTDMEKSVNVVYNGILPDLFREEQGVVTEGVIGADGSLTADSVLAKHDETYMPPEAAEALKRAGLWQHDARAAEIEGKEGGTAP